LNKVYLLKLIAIILFTCSVGIVNAQIDPKLYSGKPDYKGVYFTIDDANKNPDDVIELNLSTKGLYNIPKVILKYKNLKILELFDNYISDIPDWMVNLDKLEKLTLFKNQFKVFPASILKLKNLRVLDFSANEIGGFQKLDYPSTQKSKLNEINLSLNKISDVPQDFIYFENLKIIKLENNNLKTIPPVLFKMKSLEKLYLYHNQITDYNIDDNSPVNDLKSMFLDGNLISIKKIEELKKIFPNCYIYSGR
jgi:Leucine-rich repeat (LRR) protein